MSTDLAAAAAPPPPTLLVRTRPDRPRRVVSRGDEAAVLGEDGTADLVRVAGRINDAEHLQETLEKVSRSLRLRGRFIGQAETTSLRKARFYRRFPYPAAATLYGLDFAVHRAMPKLPASGPFYEWLMRGRRRAITRTELLGRLIAAGFEIETAEFVGGLLRFEARKVGEPRRPDSPSWGLLFRMRRVGQGGREIGVYKLRTMHPYAEYVQSYVHATQDLDDSGKFKDDFRITTWGRWFRRLWIDELPMLLNWVRGDLKLVGVRPLSAHYLSLYPEAIREKRLRTRPGLIPPFYADLPQSFDEILASEEAYLDAYAAHPWRTDARYFRRALYNILVKRARSK